MKRPNREDREERAWQKLKAAFPDKRVSLNLYRIRGSILDKSETYFWTAGVDYNEKGVWRAWGDKASTPIGAVNNLIKEVKSLEKMEE